MIKWIRNVKIIARDPEGRILDVREFRNLITTVGLNMVRDFLYGDVTDGEIEEFALGDDSTAPALTDTILGNEIFRKALTSHSKPADAQVKSTVYISPSEAVGQIEEIGFFASRDLILAEDSDPLTTESSNRLIREGKDSGLMISRVLYSRLKTNIESIQIERVDTISEA